MDYDLIIIGAGWAGVNAAITAKQSGLKTAIIENDRLGGTCLNYGCIPTKTFIQTAKIYSSIKKAESFGIDAGSSTVNFGRILARKNKLIEELRRGMGFMLKGIDIIEGKAKILAGQKVEVSGRQLSAESILIASGSKPVYPNNITPIANKILNSREILEIDYLPKSLLIIGGGIIGCEFAGLFSSLGTEVTIVEKLPRLLSGQDKEISQKLEVLFKKRGIKVNTNADFSGFNPQDYELVLVCAGRTPAIEDLELEELGVKQENGIITDEFLRTNIPNIYAAGDCTGKVFLAHYAAYQGKIAAYNIAHPRQPKEAGNRVIPSCIYTSPEIAGVGLSEEDARISGIDIKINKIDFMSSAMARIRDEKEGFIKIISHAENGVVLGAYIIGPCAEELIGGLCLAVSNSLQISQIRDTIFPHPTLVESIGQMLE